MVFVCRVRNWRGCTRVWCSCVEWGIGKGARVLCWFFFFLSPKVQILIISYECFVSYCSSTVFCKKKNNRSPRGEKRVICVSMVECILYVCIHFSVAFLLWWWLLHKKTENSRSPRGTKERFYYNNGFYYNTHSASVPPHKGKGRSPYNINKLFLSCQEYHSPNTTEHIIYSWEGNRLGWKINHSNITHKNRHCPIMLGAETRNNQTYKLWWWCTERQGEGWWGKLAEVNSASWWASAREHRWGGGNFIFGEGGRGNYFNITCIYLSTQGWTLLWIKTLHHQVKLTLQQVGMVKTFTLKNKNDEKRTVLHHLSPTLPVAPPPPPPPFLLAHSSWNHLQKSEIQYA